MKVRTILTAAALTVATAAFAAEGTFDRTLNAGASPTLNVSTGSGNIRLRPGSDNQVHIVGHVHANHGWMSGDVDSRVQQIVKNPPIVQNGNDIIVGERHNSDLYRNISIDYDITTPPAPNLAPTTGSGDVDSQNLGPRLPAHTRHANVPTRR